MADETRHDDHDKGAGAPDPTRHLLLGRRKVLEQARLLLELGGLLLQEADTLAFGLEPPVDGRGHGPEGILGPVPDHPDVKHKLDQAVHEENHDTGPQHPVARRRDESGLGDVVELVEVCQFRPLALADLFANAFAIVHQERTDEAPGSHGAEEPGKGGVEADENAGAKEGRGQLDVPAPALDVDGPVGVSAPTCSQSVIRVR